jgi:hypothetical protein
LAIRVKLLLTNCSKALHRQRKNIADAALGLDHARCIRINLQLAPQAQDLNIDAPIEDMFMNSRRIQQMLACKGALPSFDCNYPLATE